MYLEAAILPSHAYAVKNRLFELRGRSDSRFGETLFLRGTGKILLPDKYAIDLAIPNTSQQVKDAGTLALLRKNTNRFPVTTLVKADLNEYHSYGGPPSVVSRASYFWITSGQQRHWLRFVRDDSSPYFHDHIEYRLDAADVIAIVTALREDIGEIAADVRADEQMVVPLFTAIDAFSKEMSK